ncbi:MAG: ORF6N domain-containing protein [Bacteroidales bacterium]|nr:ORF6N domain-containing protein [Bacteroidales bacterium]
METSIQTIETSTAQPIFQKIYEVRNQRVMLDYDLAELYGVETRVLNQAVRRNINAFPSDFMFPLTTLEKEMMSSQIVMTSPKKRPKKSLVLAFTEHGILMLANVLRSTRAREMSIFIVRAFVVLRNFALTHQELTLRIKELENKYDVQFKDIHEALTYLLEKDKQNTVQSQRRPIGFNV